MKALVILTIIALSPQLASAGGPGQILVSEILSLAGKPALRNAYMVSKAAETGLPPNVLAQAIEEALSLRAAGLIADNAVVAMKGESVEAMQARLSKIATNGLKTGKRLGNQETGTIVSTFEFVCTEGFGGKLRTVAATVARNSPVGRSIERFIDLPIPALKNTLKGSLDSFLKNRGRSVNTETINQIVARLAGEDGSNLNAVRHFAAYLDLATKKGPEGEAALTFLKFQNMDDPNWALNASRDGNFELLHQMNTGELTEIKGVMDDIMKKQQPDSWQGSLIGEIERRAKAKGELGEDAFRVMKSLGCPPFTNPRGKKF
jgi:hypothetical protein